MKSKPLAIVSDLDDCVFSFLQGFLDYYNTVFEKEICLPDLREYNFNDGMSKALKGWERLGYYGSLPLEFGAFRFLELLAQEGVEVIFLTARPEKYRKDTEKCLKRHRITEYSDLIFSKNKAAVIEQLKSTHEILAFIDDRASTVNSVFKTCKLPYTFLINKSHNRHETVESGIVRINTILCIWKILKPLIESKMEA